MSSAEGGRWVLGITLYFLVFVIVTTLVTSLYGGVIGDYGLDSQSSCVSPRYEYKILDTDFSTTTGGETHLDCKKSIGVLSQTYCEKIEGCVWGELEPNFFQKIKIFFGSTQESIISCDGTIDNTFYEIESEDFFGSDWVAKHSNSKTLSLYGSICTHPNVINNENYCNLFSCTWDIKAYLGSDLEVPTGLGSSFNAGKRIINTISQLASFKFDFGMTGFYNLIITTFLFWIPLLALIIAFYGMVVELR